MALEQAYRVLDAAPGHVTAERVAYAAGELLLLDALGRHIAAPVPDAGAFREQLITQVNGGGDAGSSARRALHLQFRDDKAALAAAPAVSDADARSMLQQAKVLFDGGDPRGARDLYARVLEGATDRPLLDTARQGATLCQQRLAVGVAAQWTAGVRAEAEGHAAEARSHYEAVLIADPSNPSAKARLSRLAGR